MTTIAVAPSTVAPLTRKPARFGLLSVVPLVQDNHFLYGGVQAESDACSALLVTDIVCGPSAAKVAQSMTDVLTGDPWAVYIMSSCKSVGLTDAEGRARRAFDIGESAAVEKGVHQNVLVPNAFDIGGGAVAYEVNEAIGRLEQYAAENYGGQILLHLPAVVAAMAGTNGAIIQVGDHLETLNGNLVAVGAYPAEDGPAGTTAGFAWIWATGAMALVASPVTATPTVLDTKTNDVFALVERGYAAMVDCLVAAAAVEYCGCGATGPVTPPTPTATITIVAPSTGTVGVAGSHHATGTLLDTTNGVIVDGPGGATLPVTNVTASGFDFVFTPSASGSHAVIATTGGAELARKNGAITVGTTAPPVVIDITSVTPSAVDSGALIIYTVRGTGLGGTDTVNVTGPENLTGLAAANVTDTEFTFAATLTIEGIYAVAAVDGATVIDTRPMSIAVTECDVAADVIDIFTVTPPTVPEDTPTTYTVTGQLLSTIDGAHLEGPQ